MKSIGKLICVTLLYANFLFVVNAKPQYLGCEGKKDGIDPGEDRHLFFRFSSSRTPSEREETSAEQVCTCRWSQTGPIKKQQNCPGDFFSFLAKSNFNCLLGRQTRSFLGKMVFFA